MDKPGNLPVALATITALAGLGVFAVLNASKPKPALSRGIIPSPRTTLLPYLTKDQIARLPYPPTALPDGRDVDTPYGSMRVYEWGPEDGRKVLFVHGDGTPSPMFRPIMEELVAKGCRVMTFDLWGRGYSDTPAECQHDSRLYGLQILYALLSSPITWGASAPFSITGFSMGGPIALDFFAHNPDIIESVILMGPSGLIGKLPGGYHSFWYDHPSIANISTVRTLIGDLFELDTKGTFPKTKNDIAYSDEGFTPAGSRQFQFDHHYGHIVSFLSTIHYGPLQNQDNLWKAAGDILKGKDTHPGAKRQLRGTRLLCICGEDDDLVLASEIEAGLEKYMGSQHFEFKSVPGTHGFPWLEGKAVATHMLDFWSRNARLYREL